MLPCPGGRKLRPLVHSILHTLGVLYEDDVQVWGKVLQRVPLLVHLEIFLPLDAGKFAIDDAHPRLLLPAMHDELAAEHGDVGIDLIAFLVLPPCALAMKGVAGAVAADEALAAG